MSSPILQVFNRYLFPGGEEKSVDRIHRHLADTHTLHRCFFDSAAWRREGAPHSFGQLRRLFYNHESRAVFEQALDSTGAKTALFHNIYPVGSPSLYHAALQRRVPVIQYLHNFRPFSVGGTLFVKGGVCPDGLYGGDIAEVRAGAWQNSVIKSAVFATMLRFLRRSGWLRSVKAWIAISDFMRDRLVQAGLIDPARIHTLRHSWDAMTAAPVPEDAGYYLFLGRLVPEKGIAVLLDTWDMLRTRLGNKTPQLLIGGEGPLESLVRQRLRTNPFIGHLGQISGETKQETLRRCRALIAPSIWWEPLGLVAYEAYDFAKPVLAARSGGLAETVQHEITGLLHEPGEAAGLMRDVLTMESLPMPERVECGAAGRRWLLREADPQSWKKRFDEILGTVCDNAVLPFNTTP
jgi:glycosyltransferase involved in cell wall biosynthesis